MKQLNELQAAIINQLNDGKTHSGNALGLLMKLSRTAIWKQIKLLCELGLPIERIPQKGYLLGTPFILLNGTLIRDQLAIEQFNSPVQLHLYTTIDSTNRFLKELPQSSPIDICCSEMQTQGRGRFGRTWHSPFGENIYCSSRWHFDGNLSQLAGLSLVVSLAVVAALKEAGLHEHFQVKWPNDILWHDKKLCGILIEILAETHGRADVIIGIGLNVNSSHQQPPTPMSPKNAIDKPWCSLYDITKTYHDRNLLIACLINQLNQHIKKFIQQGFGAFINDWHPIDYLQDKMITVTQPTGSLKGKANGINKTGELLLIDQQGITHYLSSGDTSLHETENSHATK
jgi:BirA family biotin operon repressor/biotin-[acetyl-CoA-carboxylase] ligase